jgi:hypothetical protein
VTADLIWGGVTLIIEGRRCSCGDNVLHICVVDSRRELRCASCNDRAGLLSDKSADFIMAICRGYGPPERPVVLRRPRATNSAQAEERASRFSDAT